MKLIACRFKYSFSSPLKNNLFEITVGEKVQELQEIDNLINKQEEPPAPK